MGSTDEGRGVAMARKTKSAPPGFRILNERTELVPIDSVQPHPKNCNQADLGAIIESEDKNGFYGSLIVQESTRDILAGTHRWRAAQQLGAKEIPVTFIKCSDDDAIRIMLADNRTTRLGLDDPAALAELLQGLPSLEGTGFDADALNDLLSDLGHADEGDFPTLPAGEKQPFQQMTFTLHDSQVEQVRSAPEASARMGSYIDSPNENGNGNALARVCETFLTEHGDG